jgi:hypothetical protein
MSHKMSYELEIVGPCTDDVYGGVVVRGLPGLEMPIVRRSCGGR